MDVSLDRRARRAWVLLLGLLAFVVVAKTISIDAGRSPYSAVAPAQGIHAFTSGDVKIAALLGLVGMYRSTNGVLSAPPGTTVNVKWSNGSSEKAEVLCLVGTPCVQPLPGTQKPAEGGGGGVVVWDGAGGDGAGSGGIGGIGGSWGGGGVGTVGPLDPVM